MSEKQQQPNKEPDEMTESEKEKLLSIRTDGQKAQQKIVAIVGKAFDRFIADKRSKGSTDSDEFMEAATDLTARLQEYVKAMIAVDVSHGDVGIDYDEAEEDEEDTPPAIIVVSEVPIGRHESRGIGGILSAILADIRGD